MTQITLRKLTRPNCRRCAAQTHYLESIAADLLALGVEVIEATAQPDERVPLIVLERNGRIVTRMAGLTAPSEILDAVRSAKEDE